MHSRTAFRISALMVPLAALFWTTPARMMVINTRIQSCIMSRPAPTTLVSAHPRSGTWLGSSVPVVLPRSTWHSIPCPSSLTQVRRLSAPLSISAVYRCRSRSITTKMRMARIRAMKNFCRVGRLNSITQITTGLRTGRPIRMGQFCTPYVARAATRSVRSRKMVGTILHLVRTIRRSICLVTQS